MPGTEIEGAEREECDYMQQPPSRSDIETWWRGIAQGIVSREAAHEWAEPLMFAEYATRPDPMVMTALQYLHGFDLRFTPPDRNVVRHGPPGEYLRSLDEVVKEYWRWRRECQEFDTDPEGFRRRVREQRHASSEEHREGAD